MSKDTSAPVGHRDGDQLVRAIRPRRRPSCAVTLPPHVTGWYAHVVDMAEQNPALFIPVKVS